METNTAIDGNVFYSGTQYNPRFNNAIIMGGRIYYSEPKENTGTGGDVVCRDLRTGEELWRRSDIFNVLIRHVLCSRILQSARRNSTRSTIHNIGAQ